MGSRDFFHEVNQKTLPRFTPEHNTNPRLTTTMGGRVLHLERLVTNMPLVLLIALLIRFERRSKGH